MAITGEIRDTLLATAVRISEVRTSGREEATLGEIAQRLGELGEWGMMRSLNANRDRLLTALRMEEN